MSIKADNERIYGGRFTTAGNLYYCSSQSNVMLFDTKDPYNFRLKAEIPGWNVNWTITDMDIDAKEQFLIYSSIDQYIRLVDLNLQGK